MKKENKVKQLIRKLGKETAWGTVGKSCPQWAYEPKVPEVMKNRKSGEK